MYVFQLSVSDKLHVAAHHMHLFRMSIQAV